MSLARYHLGLISCRLDSRGAVAERIFVMFIVHIFLLDTRYNSSCCKRATTFNLPMALTQYVLLCVIMNSFLSKVGAFRERKVGCRDHLRVHTASKKSIDFLGEQLTSTLLVFMLNFLRQTESWLHF